MGVDFMDDAGKLKLEEYLEASVNKFKFPSEFAVDLGNHSTFRCQQKQCADDVKNRHNCCYAGAGKQCGPDRAGRGGYPVMWDKDATVVPAGRSDHYKEGGDAFKHQGSLMCKTPVKMGKHEHLVRVTPCWAEKKPFCSRLKVTRANAGATGGSAELVMGWSEITDPVPCAGSDCTTWDSTRRRNVVGTCNDRRRRSATHRRRITTCTEADRYCSVVSCNRRRHAGIDACDTHCHQENASERKYKAQYNIADEIFRNGDAMIREAVARLRFDAASAVLNGASGSGSGSTSGSGFGARRQL